MTEIVGLVGLCNSRDELSLKIVSSYLQDVILVSSRNESMTSDTWTLSEVTEWNLTSSLRQSAEGNKSTQLEN